jgi:[ribosomal protein S5]-alanine N-acetyltransferase
MWTPKHLLQPVSGLQMAIDRSYLQAVALLRTSFPEALIHHVGSTALPRLLCRGVVDLELLVESEECAEVARAIAGMHDLRELALPVQVHVGDRHKPSRSLRIRHLLVCDPVLQGEFLGLQKQFIHRVGKPYPEAKAAFFDERASDASASETPVDPAALQPYRIELSTERMQLVSALACDSLAQAAYRRRNREHLEAFWPGQHEENFEATFWQKSFAAEPGNHWRRQGLTLLCYRKHDGQLIGSLSFSGFVWGKFRSCTLGYNIDVDCQGAGYMSEAIKAGMHYVFHGWGVHRITAAYHASNTRSARLLERLGFRIEGHAREFIQLAGQWNDSVMTAYTR